MVEQAVARADKYQKARVAQMFDCGKGESSTDRNATHSNGEAQMPAVEAVAKPKPKGEKESERHLASTSEQTDDSGPSTKSYEGPSQELSKQVAEYLSTESSIKVNEGNILVYEKRILEFRKSYEAAERRVEEMTGKYELEHADLQKTVEQTWKAHQLAKEKLSASQADAAEKLSLANIEIERNEAKKKADEKELDQAKQISQGAKRKLNDLEKAGGFALGKAIQSAHDEKK